MDKPELAVPLCMLLLFPKFLFSGLLINFNDVPDYLIWLEYTSIFYYSFSLISRNQWEDCGKIACSAKDAAATGTGRCAFMSGEDIMVYFGIESGEVFRDVLALVLMLTFCRIACIVLIKAKAMKPGGSKGN